MWQYECSKPNIACCICQQPTGQVKRFGLSVGRHFMLQYIYHKFMNSYSISAGLAESNGSLPPGDDLKIHLRADYRYTAISSGPTLSNEYGITLPSVFYSIYAKMKTKHCPLTWICVTMNTSFWSVFVNKSIRLLTYGTLLILCYTMWPFTVMRLKMRQQQAILTVKCCKQ